MNFTIEFKFSIKKEMSARGESELLTRQRRQPEMVP